MQNGSFRLLQNRMRILDLEKLNHSKVSFLFSEQGRFNGWNQNFKIRVSCSV